jgi:hypothetical protein
MRNKMPKTNTTEAEAQKRLEEFKEAASKGEVEINGTDDETYEIMGTLNSGRERKAIKSNGNQIRCKQYLYSLSISNGWL